MTVAAFLRYSHDDRELLGDFSVKRLKTLGIVATALAFVGAFAAGNAFLTDHILRWANFLASIATIAAIVVALLTYFGDRRERERQRTEIRRALLLALNVEAVQTHASVADDIEAFDDYPKKQGFTDTQTTDYKRNFIWKPLPVSMVEKGIQEALLLSIEDDQMIDLVMLRTGVLRLNTFVQAKIAIVGARTTNPSGTSDRVADEINAEIQTLLAGIREFAVKVDGWTGERLGRKKPQEVTPQPRQG
jgi:hypothetical protein